MLVNKQNLKKYVGQSVHPEERVTEHFRSPTEFYRKSGKYISLINRATQKYGKENFEVIYLKDCFSDEELDYWEEFYIEEYNTLDGNGWGYNLIKGSLAKMNRYSLPQKVIEKMARSNQKRIRIDGRKYLGVEPKDSGRFCMATRIKGKKHHKTFETEAEAAEMYDRIVLFIHGREAKINFPEKREIYLKEDLNSIYLEFLTPRQTSSKFKHVFLNHNKTWCIDFNKSNKTGQRFYLGSFTSEEEAAKIVDKFMFLYNDVPIENLNFPELAVHYEKEELRKFFERFTYKSAKLFKEGSFKGVNKEGKKWKTCLKYQKRNITLTSCNLTQKEALESLKEYLSEFVKDYPNIDNLKHLKVTPSGYNFIVNKLSLEKEIVIKLERLYEHTKSYI